MAPTDRRATAGSRIRLGLIGDNIKRSRSPDLHRLAGRLCGLDVSYDLFVPRDMGKSFDAAFEACRDSGVHGVNVTYPYKEIAVAKAVVGDDATRRIGAINTVVFEAAGPLGHNTDHSGFIAAYRDLFGAMQPGKVALIGAGGVGKAVAFGLAALGAETLTIVDVDKAKAGALARSIAAVHGDAIATMISDDVRATVPGADGIVNCTPLGMIGQPGSAVPADLLGPQRWAFEAVYTPVDTLFKKTAEAAGLKVLSGYELFFHQGVDAFRIFTGQAPTDLSELRRLLAETPTH
ncbi:shikimate dehydrogenase family protein [Mesorhizobium opportunistum]|nr:ThiF family adenylyltransferase [Mesorhizobium opportunistum]